MGLKSSALTTTFARLGATCLSMLAGVFIARLIGPEGKGVFAILTADVELCVLFFSVALPSGIVQFWDRGQVPNRVVAGLSVWISSISLFLALAILFADLPRAQRLLVPAGPDTVLYKNFILLSFLASYLSALGLAVLQARNRIASMNRIAVLNAFLSASVFATIYLVTDLRSTISGLKAALLVSLLLSVTNLVYVAHQCRALVDERPRLFFSFDPGVRAFVRFILIGHVSVLVNFLNYRLDLWVLQNFMGSGAVGIYSLAVNLAQFIWLIPGAIAVVLLPYFLASSKDEASTALAFFSRFNFMVSLLLASVGASLASFLIPRVYGSAFSQAVGPFRLLLVAVVAGSFTKVFSLFIVARGDVIHNLVATSVGLVLTATLDLTLIPALGIQGACIATGVSYITMACCVYYSVVVVNDQPRVNYFLPTLSELRSYARAARSISRGGLDAIRDWAPKARNGKP